ncbi:MAG: nitroreductase family protein, partial [Nanoarchaeota archaeon]
INSLPQYCLEQEFVAGPVVIIACSNNEIMERHYGIRGSRLYAVQDCAAAIQNMLLAAHALGLGSCWIGSFDEEKMNDLFSIPAHVRAQAIIVLGYPDEIPKQKDLRKLDDVVYFNKYGAKVKDIHLVLRNYADEIAKHTAEAKKVIEKGKTGIAGQFQKARPKERLKGLFKR